MRAYRRVEDQYHLRIDGSRMALLGVGAALVLLLVFLLGVLVGKGIWGGRRPATLPLVERPSPTGSPEVRSEPRPEGAVPSVAEKRRPEYTFYEELKKPDEPATEEPEPQPGPVVKPVDAAPEPAPKPALEAVEKAPPAKAPPEPAPRELPEAKQPPEPEEEPKPRAEPKPKQERTPRVPAPVFTVQVGSFRDRAAAQNLAREMNSQGVAAAVTEASVAGRTWYRVQVGRFQTRAEAQNHYRNRLRAKGIQGFVTTR